MILPSSHHKKILKLAGIPLNTAPGKHGQTQLEVGRGEWRWAEAGGSGQRCVEAGRHRQRQADIVSLPRVWTVTIDTLTWWTIGMLMLTNLFTMYIHFSHTLAGVITTSLTILYLPSNPLQPCSIACVSFWIITRLLTLICRQFSWPYSC